MSRRPYLPSALRFVARHREVNAHLQLPRESVDADRSSRRRRYVFKVGDSGWVTVSTVRRTKQPADDGV